MIESDPSSDGRLVFAHAVQYPCSYLRSRSPTADLDLWSLMQPFALKGANPHSARYI
jgi:hypothetical protein